MGTKLNPIYVTNLSDDSSAAGSLRYAVAQVNNGNYDSILIDESLAHQSLELLSSLTFNADTSVDGNDFTISEKPVMIRKNLELNGLHFNFNGIQQGLLLLTSDLTLNLDSTISLTNESDSDISGIRLNNNLTAMTVMLADSAEMNIAQTGTGNSYGFYANAKDASLTFGTIGNNLTVSALSGAAAGLWSTFSDGTQTLTGEDFSGDWNITGGNTAYGFYLKSSGEVKLTLKNVTGNLTVKALQGEAYGFYSYSSGNSTVSLGELEGSINVTAENGSATGIYSFSYDSASTITIGDITGDITVTATGGSSTGIYSYTYSLYSTSTITIGDITGNITVTATGAATGIYAYASYYYPSTITIGDITGNITVTATGGSSTGIYSYDLGDSSTITIGDITGDIKVTATNGSATGINSFSTYSSAFIKIKSLSGSVTSASSTGRALGMTSQTITDPDGNAFTLTGAVIADGKSSDSSALEGTTNLNVSISGIAAAGYFNTTASETGMSDLISGLKAKNESVIESAARGSIGYKAISSGSGDGTVTVNDGALVFGGISTGSGADTVTISTGARIYGNITADSAMNLTFNADALSTHAALTVSGDGIFATDKGNYRINIAGTAQNGSYLLTGGLSEGILTDKLFTLQIDAQEEFFLVGESVVSGGKKYALSQVHSALALTVTDSAFVDTEAPEQVANVTATRKAIDTVRLGWDAASDNVGTVVYQVSFGGNDYYTSDCWLYVEGLSDGTYEYQVRALDAAGNSGVWSETGSIYTGPITITANSNSKTYDGTALTDSGYTFTENALGEGDTLTAVVEGTITNAGTAENQVVSYKIMRGDVDVTSSYAAAATVAGTLTVNQKEISVAADDKVKSVDQADPELTYTADALCAGDSFTGALTREAGNEIGTYAIQQGTLTAGDNYKINFTEGVLTICQTHTELVSGGTNCNTAAATEWDNHTGDTTLTINDGTYDSNVIGSDIVSSGSSERTGNATFTINGGTFNKFIAAGMYFRTKTRAEGYENDMACLTGNTNFTINGGTFAGYVYGGNTSSNTLCSAHAILYGNTSLTINANQKINFNSYVIAGSRGQGNVAGNVLVTVTGDGSNLHFGTDAKTGMSYLISGGSESAYYRILSGGERQAVSYVTGTRELVFSGFSNDFSGRLDMFESIEFANGTDMSFSGTGIKLTDVGEWDLNWGSTADLTGVTNSFSGDTLDIRFDASAISGSQNLLTGAAGAFDSLFDGTDADVTVQFNGSAEGVTYADGCWTKDSFRLSVNEDKSALIFAAIA